MSVKSSSNGENKDEPSTAPQSDRWYTLTLGSSFKDPQPSSKFCTLRYEFKPASIDKSQTGLLHKNKENRVTVEFQNNQPGKPKVTFEGSSEDYKENDAVLFFDGDTFRLERLHRAVKRLRHLRQPGESATAALTASVGVAADASSPPAGKAVKGLNLNRSVFNPSMVEVERIDIGDFGNSGTKPTTERPDEVPPAQPNHPTGSPNSKNDDLDEQLDIVNDDDEECGTASKDNAPKKASHTSIDINLPHQMDTDEIDVDVDINDDDDDAFAYAGFNSTEAPGPREDAERREEQTSCSSGSSGSESSGTSSRTGSGSSSSDSESSGNADSVNSI
ncbi:hypothetical protein Nepgr_022486 [Nepenthes gracilis]|uniref:Transcription elongation factor Eaf N-terminal domain-containing protein n=1 Tax=Nepenthes gracilis TaxID=150966 RepID=A0AAD3SZM7_NEPGR|nr:hypothetical protein Nepgr_022486 [Nepenthes gracilis]